MFRMATVYLVVLSMATNCWADTINYNTGGHSLRNRNISHQYPTVYKNWKWGNVGRTKPNDAYRLESLIDIPADEKWMKRLDLPSLHLILANYAEAAAKTAWLRNVGRPFRSRLLRLLLRSNIRRFSGAVGDIDIEPESRQRVNSFLLSPCSSGMIEMGVCLSTPVCSLVGGARMNGNCYFGKSCCVINKVETSCSASVTMNNTFWQSTPNGLNSGYTCAINIQLNSAPLTRKYPPICQVRLDFDLFSIAQPTTESTCSTDSFQVTGSTNNVPVICGDNARQHMYLMSTSAATKIQLLFSFGESTAYVDRSWRIKIALLPCSADYLAPASCLQYFTSSTGNVKSFGWKDLTASSTSVGQLANQNYKICFRSELNQNGQIPMSFCVSECASTTGRAFSLSRNSIDDITSSAGGTGVAPEDMCAFDFIVLAGGYDTAGDTNDRFCGNRLSANPGTAASATICTTMKPFSIFYVTNGQESDPNTNPVQADVGNNGFCLTFTQF